jgi:hypothetical protein
MDRNGEIHVKWSNPDSERQRSHVFVSYVEDRSKYKCKHLYTQTHTSTHTHTCTHTHICVKQVSNIGIVRGD